MGIDNSVIAEYNVNIDCAILRGLLKTNSSKQKSPESRNRRAIIRVIQNLGLWIIITGVLSAIFLTIEELTSGPPHWRSSGWALPLSLFVIILGFNIASADILRHYIRKHDRNIVAWTTAIIVFTPFLAAIAYFLTWSKNQRLTGLDS